MKSPESIFFTLIASSKSLESAQSIVIVNKFFKFFLLSNSSFSISGFKSATSFFTFSPNSNLAPPSTATHKISTHLSQGFHKSFTIIHSGFFHLKLIIFIQTLFPSAVFLIFFPEIKISFL